VCVGVCVFVCVRVSVCVYLGVCEHVCVYVGVCEHVFLFFCVFACVLGVGGVYKHTNRERESI